MAHRGPYNLRSTPPGMYESVQIDLASEMDATDPYGLGSARRLREASPAYDTPGRRPYYDTPYPNDQINTPPYSLRGQTPFYDPSGEATQDLRAVYDTENRLTPRPYEQSESNYGRSPSPLKSAVHDFGVHELTRRHTRGSKATSHSGRAYADSADEDDDFDEKSLGRNVHIGPAPEEKHTRRNQTTKRVVLTNGNVVLDCPVPTRLRSFLPRKDHEEFVFMRYSAVTCDPNDFDRCQFTLRPVLYQRDTELLIGITMYNVPSSLPLRSIALKATQEDEVLFTRTLHHVMKNIAHLCSRVKSQTWGTDGWKKIVVCIISDGRKAINPRVLDVLAALGVYQDGVAKNAVRHDGEEKTVEAHLYEYTTQLSVEPSKLQFRGLEKGITPVQILFCLKEKNAKKLNSHRWFFNAVAPLLQPNICILLDVGTKPGPKSLYHLWKTFDLNSNVGGACGEICAMKGKFGLALLNPLVGAQNFEYKLSNILDKPTESLFGYISVLPGAFSACYVALLNDATKKGPLASYFKGETLAGYDADVYTSNMYLAEDRILCGSHVPFVRLFFLSYLTSCWELVAKRGHHWVLKYVRQAQGETDVPDTVAEWISQRRRWLNGSFFAAIYSLTHVLQIFTTDHSLGRKLALLVEAFYNFLNLVFAWFGMANYYIFFMILTSSLEDPHFGIKHIHVLNVIMQYFYAATLISCFIFALGNRPQGSHWKYVALIASFGVLNVYMIVAAVISVFKAFKAGAGTDSTIFASIIISMLSTFGCYVAASLIAFDPWHLVTSMGQYLLLAPVFVNLLNTYAFCNLHDFSWGTKSLDKSGNDLGVVVVGEKNAVDIVLPTAQADIDLAYDDALHNLRTRPRLVAPQKTAAQKELMKQDYYRNVRTNVVLLWCLSNGVLAAAICGGDLTKSFATGAGELRVKIYMIVILFFVACMAAFRFVASTAYRIITLFTK